MFSSFYFNQKQNKETKKNPKQARKQTKTQTTTKRIPNIKIKIVRGGGGFSSGGAQIMTSNAGGMGSIPCLKL